MDKNRHPLPARSRQLLVGEDKPTTTNKITDVASRLLPRRRNTLLNLANILRVLDDQGVAHLEKAAEQLLANRKAFKVRTPTQAQRDALAKLREAADNQGGV